MKVAAGKCLVVQIIGKWISPRRHVIERRVCEFGKAFEYDANHAVLRLTHRHDLCFASSKRASVYSDFAGEIVNSNAVIGQKVEEMIHPRLVSRRRKHIGFDRVTRCLC